MREICRNEDEQVRCKVNELSNKTLASRLGQHCNADAQDWRSILVKVFSQVVF